MSDPDGLFSALRGIVGESGVIRDPDLLGSYAVDGRAPKAVVLPGTEEEVAGVVRLANAERLAIVPRGNGGMMACGGIPRKVDIVLSTLRLDRIVDYDVANLSLSVEAGITLAEVQKEVAGGGKGNFLPLDPPRMEKATIGGIVAANASGPKRYLYGTVRDLLLGVRAVTPEGDIVSFGGKTMKNVSGYDMTRLMAGSWGALGVITGVTTKLLPLPAASASLLASFDALAAAGPFVRRILHSALLPSAVDLIGGKAAERLGEKTKYLLAFSLEGFAEEVDRQVAEIESAAKTAGAASVKVLKGKEDGVFWAGVRDFHLEAGNGYSPPVVLKSNFPISKHAEILEAYEKAAEAAGIDAAFILRAGNGILYTHIPGEAKKAGGLAELIGRLTEESVKREGNLVVESCPPEIKEKVCVWGRQRNDQVVMRRLKKKMDPQGVMSPGRFVGGI
ncbi:MAG: FAD-binding oxidoreductase [Deltaproteobacteria bacterium]|nr:FAD-binding oxidoreductase [Deltaproteobacteria bacterium]